jgi:hypothetical protein
MALVFSYNIYMRNNKGQFTDGNGLIPVPVGTIRVRKDRNKNGKRAWIKVAEPNDWVLRARHVWEQVNGPIPPGMGIHHRDGDKLNDTIENLQLVTKSEHLSIHRGEYKDRRTEAFTQARRELRWSTRSETKRTGRPASWSEEQMTRAIEATKTRQQGVSVASIAKQHGVTVAALYKRLQYLRDAAR